jgi:hypothetical protein
MFQALKWPHEYIPMHKGLALEFQRL